MPQPCHQALTLILRAPGLGRRQVLGDALMYWLVNRTGPCVFGPMDRDDTWFLGAQIPPDAPMDAEAHRARAARAVGPDIAFEIIASDVWSALQLQAASYGTARVQLAGDACHLHPPFGGYGMNLGIADAVDLGWKISALLQGWGGAGLLASYEAERRPVHRRVIDESVENMGTLAQHFFHPDIEDAGAAGDAARATAAAAVQASKDQEFHSLGLVIGYDYESSPIVVPDGSALPPRTVSTYRASAHPGRRAPHAWLADVSREGLGELYGARLALIRPDQHVAWRGDTAADAETILDRVRGA